MSEEREDKEAENMILVTEVLPCTATLTLWEGILLGPSPHYKTINSLQVGLLPQHKLIRQQTGKIQPSPVCSVIQETIREGSQHTADCYNSLSLDKSINQTFPTTCQKGSLASFYWNQEQKKKKGRGKHFSISQPRICRIRLIITPFISGQE